MKIQELEPMKWMLESDFWHLLKENNEYYLSVSCEHSAVSFDLVFELNEKEKEELRTMGWSYIQYLANRVNNYTKEYHGRRIEGGLKDQIDKLIIEQRNKT